jgi:serine/threonine protein kinase
MSPEQVMGHEGSHASDIYSLGVVMYELLTGVTPFAGDSEFEIMQAHTSRKPVPPSALNPSIPAALNGAILKALAKTPSQRFAGAGEFGRRLQQIAGTLADAARPPQWTPPKWKLPALPVKWKLPALPDGWKLPANIDRQYLAGALFLTVSLLVACLAIFSGGRPQTDEHQSDAVLAADSAVTLRIEVETDMDMDKLMGHRPETLPPADRPPVTGGADNLSRSPRRTETGERKKTVPPSSGKKDKKDSGTTPETIPSASPEKQSPAADTSLPKDSPPEVRPVQSPSANGASALPVQVVIPRGTRVNTRLDETCEYDSVPDGMRVTLSVSEPLVHAGVTVVPAGAKAYALLRKNTRRRELELEILEVESITGQRLKALKTTYRNARFAQGNPFRVNLEYNRIGK